MAAPGYPQMGQMPPGMGGPGMGHGPSMGSMPMPNMRPIRRGTSKAVPVVMSAGLAVGVFCGLLFGVGTGKDAAIAAPAASNVKKTAGGDDEPKPEPGAAPKGLGATPAQPVTPKSGTGSGAAVAVAQTAGTGSAGAGTSAPAAGSGAAKPAVEESKVIKLTFKLKPEAAEKDAKITIDGKAIDGLTTEVPTKTKSFKLEIKSTGFRTLEQKMSVVDNPGEELQYELELQKKPTGTPGVRPPRRPDRPTNAGGTGGGLIDI